MKIFVHMCINNSYFNIDALFLLYLFRFRFRFISLSLSLILFIVSFIFLLFYLSLKDIRANKLLSKHVHFDLRVNLSGEYKRGLKRDLVANHSIILPF